MLNYKTLKTPPSAKAVKKKPFKQTQHEAINMMSGADANMTQILEEGVSRCWPRSIIVGFIIDQYISLIV